MTNQQEYPLIENLENVKFKYFKTPNERLYAIVNVLDEEALTRWKDDNTSSVVPAALRRQSIFRWDVASLIFIDTDVIQLIYERKTYDMVTKYHILCLSMPDFYDMAANIFYTFYGEDTTNGLTAEKNDFIIKEIFGNHFNELNYAFESWLVPHVSSMLIAHPNWNNIDHKAYTASQINHYRTTYKNSFFMPHIEKAIQNVTSKNI
jgi:hypothetical protein